jgi:hypothetical protein
MQPAIVIEDIRELRRVEGIEDDELVAEIRGLRAGDCVRLTFETGTKPCTSETLVVRIVRVSHGKYDGTLVTGARAAALSALKSGSHVSFTAAHIHSCTTRQPAPADGRKKKSGSQSAKRGG